MPKTGHRDNLGRQIEFPVELPADVTAWENGGTVSLRKSGHYVQVCGLEAAVRHLATLLWHLENQIRNCS
jgi:hypothetical protein